MRKLILGVMFLWAGATNAQQLLEVLKPHTTNTFTPNEKCLERVYDRNYGDGDHNFIYCAVQGPNGKKWLNLNLGAEYAKESSPYFNPEAVPTSYNDWKAFGSLFQYGRRADGHELMIYIKGTELNWGSSYDSWWVEPRYGVTNIQQDPFLSTNRFFKSMGELQPWTSPVSHDYWREGTYANNPCPIGYRIMAASDVLDWLGNELGVMDPLINGSRYTTSVLYKNEYPDLYMVTAPTIRGNEQHIDMTVLLTDTKMEYSGLRGYGTSALWLLPQPHENYTTGYVWVGSKNPQLQDLSGKGGTFTIFDRGVFVGNVVGEYGLSGHWSPRDDYGARAIRCVEN